MESVEGCRQKSMIIVQWFLVFFRLALPLQVKKVRLWRHQQRMTAKVRKDKNNGNEMLKKELFVLKIILYNHYLVYLHPKINQYANK